MLILTRRPGQAIKIGEDVTVTVLEAGNGRTRLGIDAPRAVSVRRVELRESEHADPHGTDADLAEDAHPHGPAAAN